MAIGTEALARYIHEASAIRTPWESLPEEDREAARRQANNLMNRLDISERGGQENETAGQAALRGYYGAIGGRQ